MERDILADNLLCSFVKEKTDEDIQKLREMIARCQWTFAKTMPWCPHEYIVRGK